jgi:hypothetical protein
MPTKRKRRLVPDERADGEHSGRDGLESHSPSSAGAIDVEKLADRVHQLLMRDVRLELSRGARSARGKEG